MRLVATFSSIFPGPHDVLGPVGSPWTVTGSDECQMSPKTSDLFFGMSWSVDTVI